MGLPVNNPYDGVTPSPADEKIIDWKGTYVVAWADLPGVSNRLHLSLLSGKTVASVLPASGKLAQEITVPLFRDFARIRVYLASAPRYGPRKLSWLPPPQEQERLWNIQVHILMG